MHLKIVSQLPSPESCGSAHFHDHRWSTTCVRTRPLAAGTWEHPECISPWGVVQAKGRPCLEALEPGGLAWEPAGGLSWRPVVVGTAAVDVSLTGSLVE